MPASNAGRATSAPPRARLAEAGTQGRRRFHRRMATYCPKVGLSLPVTMLTLRSLVVARFPLVVRRASPASGPQHYQSISSTYSTTIARNSPTCRYGMGRPRRSPRRRQGLCRRALKGTHTVQHRGRQQPPGPAARAGRGGPTAMKVRAAPGCRQSTDRHPQGDWRGYA